MRILNENDNHSLKKVILYLTMEEALELKDSVLDLIENPMNNHAHISSDDLKKEITLCIYDPNNLKDLNQRSIDLILNDE